MWLFSPAFDGSKHNLWLCFRVCSQVFSMSWAVPPCSPTYPWPWCTFGPVLPVSVDRGASTGLATTGWCMLTLPNVQFINMIACCLIFEALDCSTFAFRPFAQTWTCRASAELRSFFFGGTWNCSSSNSSLFLFLILIFLEKGKKLSNNSLFLFPIS